MFAKNSGLMSLLTAKAISVYLTFPVIGFEPTTSELRARVRKCLPTTGASSGGLHWRPKRVQIL